MEIEVREMGGFPMSVNLRLKHDRSFRERVAEMLEKGLGCKSIAGEPGVPAEAVGNRQKACRAVGKDGLLAMGKKQARHSFETKATAASASAGPGRRWRT